MTIGKLLKRSKFTSQSSGEKPGLRLLACLLPLFLIITFSSALHAATAAQDFGKEPDWKASFKDVSRHVKPLVRTYHGLDDLQRSRIMRFQHQSKYFGQPVMVYYNFLSGHLYEIEYSFHKSNDLVQQLVIRRLVELWGRPSEEKTSQLPQGTLFSERSAYDLLWEKDGVRLNLHKVKSRFANGMDICSLFVSIRGPQRSQAKRPLQKMTDDKIAEGGQLVTLAFGGGIHLGSSYYKNPLDNEESSALLANVEHHLSKADLAIATLDGVLARSEGESEQGQLFSIQSKLAKSLEKSGIDLLNIAAPESDLYGLDGIAVSREALLRSGIKVLGVGKSQRVAGSGEIVNVKGLKLGFLGYMYRHGEKDCASCAGENSPGLAAGTDVQKLRRRVAADVARLVSLCDKVIVLISWSGISEDCPTNEQSMLIDAAQRAGAAIVIGYKKHSLQPIRDYKGKLALVSLGDLVFGEKHLDAEGMIFKVELNAQGVISYDFIPIAAKGKGSKPYLPVTPSKEVSRQIKESFETINRQCR